MKKLLCLLMALTITMTIVGVDVSAELDSSLIESSITGNDKVVKKNSTINAWMNDGTTAASRASADYLEVIATGSSLTGMMKSSAESQWLASGSSLTEDRFAKISFDYKNGKKDGSSNTGNIQFRMEWASGNDQWIYCRPNDIYSNKNSKVIGNYNASGYTHFDLVFNLKTGTCYAFIDGSAEPVDTYTVASSYLNSKGLNSVYFYGASQNGFRLTNPKRVLYTSGVTFNMIKNDIAGISDIHVTGVSLDKTSDSILIGETTQLIATVSPSDATNKIVRWASNNTDVATVNDSGLVTGVGEGSATITVTTVDGSKTATCTIDVQDSDEVILPIESKINGFGRFWLNGSNATAQYFDEQGNNSSIESAYKATVTKTSTGTNGVFQTNNGYTVDTTKQQFVRQSFDLDFIALNSGRLQFRIVSDGNWQFINCETTGININNPLTNIYSGALEGETIHFDLVYDLSSYNIHVFLDGEYKYTGAISSTHRGTRINGIYFYGSVGNIVFSLSDYSETLYSPLVQYNQIYSEICGIENINVEGISLNKATLELEVDASETLIPSFTPAGATNTDVIWTSSENNVATVNAEGTVTAISEGEAIITATTKAGGFSDTCVITVVDKRLPVDVELTALVADGSEYIAVVNTVGITGADSKLIVAAYNKDNVLIGIGLIDYAAAIDCEIPLSINGFDVNTTTLKTFVIDLSTMIPYSLAPTYNASDVFVN